MANEINIDGRLIGDNYPPLVIAEVGINHEGNYDKAVQMVDDARAAGCECVKFQCHIIEDEMSHVAKSVIPGHTKESIWEIMQRCVLNEEQERNLMDYVELKGMIYMSTPFSRAAADRLHSMDVPGYKIGSGECNNYPLIEHIASFGKPIILSTGMNNIDSIAPSVDILRKAGIPYALTHCTSLYPTPYAKVRLGALADLQNAFPDAVVGLSDHTLTNYTCLAAVSLGARILERHFTSDKNWPGPDMSISMDPGELKDLIEGSKAVFEALGGSKEILPEEQPTIDFAYATVVSIKDIEEGEELSKDNIWVKRPGTGRIFARDFNHLIGKKARRRITNDTHLEPEDIIGYAS